MTRARAAGLLLVAAFAGCGGDAGPAPVPTPWSAAPELALDLRCTVAPDEVGLLQPVTVTLDLYRAADVQVGLAPVVDDADFVVDRSDVGEERPLGPGFTRRATLVVLPVAGPGELTLPAFRVEGANAAGEPVVATTPEHTVVVSSALTPEDGAEIEAPGSPFATPWPWGWWLGGAGLVLCGGAALWWLARRRGGRAPDNRATIAQPPHVRALRELQRWRAAERTTPAEIEAFYVGVSHVLRVYLEERFGLRAPERTTEEFLRDLERGDALAREHRAELQRFLERCDLVKFAAMVPSVDDHDATYTVAERFVEATRPDRVGGAALEAAR